MQKQTTNNQKQIQKQYGPHKKNSVRTIVLWNFPDNNYVCPKWNFPAQDIQAILFIPSQLFIHREDI
jgi:hypothetical protein